MNAWWELAENEALAPDRRADEKKRGQDGASGNGGRGPQAQPERHEPKLADPTPTKLSSQDYFAILRRAAKEVGDDHLTNIAAALAYYAFLAIPSVLMVAVGMFALVGDPGAVNTVVGKLGTVVGELGAIIPGQAQSLLRSSLTSLTQTREWRCS